MRRLLLAVAVLMSLPAIALAQLTLRPESTQQNARRQIPEGADWKALFNGRMHYYRFGTIDQPLEKTAFRVFRSDGSYRVQTIDNPNQGVDGRWYFQADGMCQLAFNRTYCYGFARRDGGWEQRSNDEHRFLVFIPDVLPPDVRLPE